MDSEDSDGRSTDCATVVLYSLQKFFGVIVVTTGIIQGQTTDSGGGGSGKSFFEALRQAGLCAGTDPYVF
jgi:hypothetical protein